MAFKIDLIPSDGVERGHLGDSRAAPHPVLKKYYATEGDRQAFVTALFDGGARHYDWVCALGSLGSGQFYRQWILSRSGLRGGMQLLDIATGTGLVARAAVRILGEPGAVVGVDPSRGMLEEARKTLSIPLVQATVEALPFEHDHFDFLSMGYALRHVADLGVAFGECRRVLKPGGRLLILEISRPRPTVGQWLLRLYFQNVLPLIARLGTRSRQAELLTKYYWDTIAACVSPATIVGSLRASGFVEVEHRVRGGLLSEYVGRKPAAMTPERLESGAQRMASAAGEIPRSP
jgi:demethylmenaquinone methyltransferase / 2-methoxy-6-polyprenyl-1,4-benzoquinol methylase